MNQNKSEKSEKVVEQVRGVTLVARRTSKGRISYMLKMFVDGERIRKTLFSAGERDRDAQQKAKAMFKEHVYNIARGTFTSQTAQFDKEDFFKFIEELIPTKKPVSRKAWRNTLYHLRKWNGGKPMPFKQLTKAKAFGFRAYLQSCIEQKKLRPNSANMFLAKFRAALNECVKLDIVPFSPASALASFESEDSRTEFLTISELNKLISTPLPPIRGYDPTALRCFVIFQARTGLRPNDSRRLIWSDIQTTDGREFFISIVPSKTRRKNAMPQFIPLHADAVDALAELKKRTPNFDSSNPIFLGLPRPESDAVTKWLRRWAERAGIKKHLSVYSLRHTYASNLIEVGRDLYEVSKLLSHSSTRHTQRYAHLSDRQKLEAVRALPPLSEPTAETAQ